MKRPTSVRIGVHVLPVIWSKKEVKKQEAESIREGITEKGESLLGQYDGRHGKIYMLPRKKMETQLRETLLHELLHAIGDLCGVPWATTEEEIVRAISPNLMLVMEQNPDVHRYIFGRA